MGRTRQVRPAVMGKGKSELKRGLVIQFEHALRFRGGRIQDTFRIIDPKRSIFYDSSGYIYRIPMSYLDEANWAIVV